MTISLCPRTSIHHLSPSEISLKDRNRPGWAAHPALHMQRRTRQKETPPPRLLTLLTQRLQIPHLPNRRPPLHEQPLMQTPSALQIRRPGFKRHAVPRHGREVVLVEPAHGRLVGLQPDAEGVFLRAEAALGRGGGVVPAHVAGAEDEDVTDVESCALVLEGGFDLGDGDLVAADGGGGVAVFGLVPAELR